MSKKKTDPFLNSALKQAVSLQKSGNFPAAEVVLKNIIQKHPRNPDAFHLLGLLYHQAGKSQFAVPLIEQAIKFDKKRSYFHNNLGNAYKEMGEIKKAEFCFKRALKLDPRYVAARSNLGNAYLNQGEADKAIREQEKAIATEPNSHTAFYNLGNALLEKGEKEKAIAAFRKTIEINPDFAAAYRNIAEARKFTEVDADLKNLENQISTNTSLPPKDIVQLHFGAAKAYEDLKDTKQCWQHLKQANDLYRKTYDYSVEDDLKLMRGMQEVVTRAFLDRHSIEAVAKPNPIFIVGMPRSGTSLVEQILASHSQIHGAGELYFFEQIVYHGIKKGKSILPHTALTDFETRDFPPLAVQYCDKLRTIKTKLPFITDKMPRNFLYVGLIKLLFPNAIFIHCTRQPEDSCLSIYKKLFVGKQYFAYNLEEQAHYYNGYLDLMSYWNSLLPGEILELSYENMVADTEAQSRRLVEHCHLDWEEACLNFHKTKRVINTASTAQVRQPIYTSSVQAWKKYETELQPLTQILKA